MKKILCKVIELVFPEHVKRIKAEQAERRAAKRSAMQQMLDADLTMRANGCTTDWINEKLHNAVRMYDRKLYQHVGANVPACL